MSAKEMFECRECGVLCSVVEQSFSGDNWRVIWLCVECGGSAQEVPTPEQAYERGLRAALDAVSYKGLLKGGKLWCDIDPDGLLRPEDVRVMCYEAIERLLEEAGKGRVDG